MLNRTALEQMMQTDRRNRLFRLCKDLKVAQGRRSTEFDGMARPPPRPAVSMRRTAGGIIVVELGIAKTAEENRDIIAAAKTYERIGGATKKIKARVTSSPLCRQVGDADLHERDAGTVVSTVQKILGDFETGPAGALEPESFERYVRSEVNLASLGMTLFMELSHVLLISKALGMGLGEELRDAVGTVLFDAFERTLRSERCKEIVDLLRANGEEKLASMVLAGLYGEADAKRRMRIVLGDEERSKPMAAPRVEAKLDRAVPKPVDELADKVRELVDAGEDELKEYRGEFAGDAEKIAKAISISRAGASKKLAVFAVENSLGDEVLSFMIDAEEMICPLGTECTAVFRALDGLSARNRETLLGSREIMDKAAAWLAMMPNYMRERPELAFLLGLNFEAPGDKASAHSFLAAHQAELEDVLLRNEANLGRLESDLDAFDGYLQGFVKNGKRGEKPAEECAPEPVRQRRPHESLVFSQTALDAMRGEEIDPEDARITLVYGLRLNSAKGARGATYFNAAVFRKNTERDLAEERRKLPDNGERKIPIHRRRERTERFLARHGALSFYKSRDDVVRLNIGDCGTDKDDVGRAIIADTIRWMREFQRETTL